MSTNNFLSPNLVYDWLIFWKFDISSKRQIKMIKTQFFGKNDTKNCQKLYINKKQYSLLRTRFHCPMM